MGKREGIFELEGSSIGYSEEKIRGREGAI